MSRKNISDYLTNDRAVARDLREKGTSYGKSWDDYYGTSANSGRSYGNGSMTSYKFSPRCYEEHKPLQLPKSKLEIYGGSCSTPIVSDADVYIGFDGSMKRSPNNWPWRPGVEVLFKVPDMGVPKEVGDYHKLVQWTKKQLEAGAKVHAGCIGGHGRTGMFLAALVSAFGEKDAIAYVRKNYCKKAVESKAQVEFLMKEFGVITAEPTKTYETKKVTKLDVVEGDLPKTSEANRTYKPLKGEKGIWG